VPATCAKDVTEKHNSELTPTGSGRTNSLKIDANQQKVSNVFPFDSPKINTISKKAGVKVWFQNKAEVPCIRGAQTKMQSWPNFGHGLIPTNGKPTKCFDKPSGVSAANGLILLLARSGVPNLFLAPYPFQHSDR